MAKVQNFFSFYDSITQEKTLDETDGAIKTEDLPENWISKGSIEFKNVEL